jgi:hypothetical protein
LSVAILGHPLWVAGRNPAQEANRGATGCVAGAGGDDGAIAARFRLREAHDKYPGDP